MRKVLCFVGLVLLLVNQGVAGDPPQSTLDAEWECMNAGESCSIADNDVYQVIIQGVVEDKNEAEWAREYAINHGATQQDIAEGDALMATAYDSYLDAVLTKQTYDGDIVHVSGIISDAYDYMELELWSSAEIKFGVATNYYTTVANPNIWSAIHHAEDALEEYQEAQEFWYNLPL